MRMEGQRCPASELELRSPSLGPLPSPGKARRGTRGEGWAPCKPAVRATQVPGFSAPRVFLKPLGPSNLPPPAHSRKSAVAKPLRS